MWVTTSSHPDTVVLIVENTGDQLTPQMVCTLVEPFQRGSERVHSDHGGVGLGLAIVDSITRAHDGTLTLSPRAGGGLRVTVQLPARHGPGPDQGMADSAQRYLGPVPGRNGSPEHAE